MYLTCLKIQYMHVYSCVLYINMLSLCCLQEDPFKGFKPIHLKFAKKADPTFTLDEKIAAARNKWKKQQVCILRKNI